MSEIVCCIFRSSFVFVVFSFFFFVWFYIIQVSVFREIIYLSELRVFECVSVWVCVCVCVCTSRHALNEMKDSSKDPSVDSLDYWEWHEAGGLVVASGLRLSIERRSLYMLPFWLVPLCYYCVIRILRPSFRILAHFLKILCDSLEFHLVSTALFIFFLLIWTFAHLSGC